MQIPARLLSVLTHDQALDGAIKLSISRFEPWIKSSNLPFFPEYTDHGISHLEQVLATASSLIRDEAWKDVTPEDAAVLILSVLLHDCAMHLSESAFVALLSDPWRDRSLAHMDEPSWSVLWEEFLGEASRFDGRKLKSLFGVSEPTRRPPLDPLTMEMRDRLLIGEFLRRHHPRLAHEIAAFGVPGPNSAPLSLQGFDEIASQHIAELAGLVARSHGTHIRALLPVIEKRFGQAGQRECCGVHPAFLMAVLRIADYVQVHAERAPAQLLRIKRLHSPVSLREWKAHHAIRDIRQSIDDPEAIYIEARPNDVATFFRVQEWNIGIQRELDESWAVLGEVYGRVKELVSLGLVIRRVRSNLEDVKSLDGEIDYLPVRASFRAADADLLKLLIGPLYGDSPGIGMRELIQNAIDAVRELGQLLADRSQTTANVELTQQDADVVCSIDKDADGQHWVTVSDRGIGMTADVVVNYFLNAGASFRRSDDWRKSFETADGKSKVLRAGRFGVGALAAFLLGSEIHVTTRHVDASEGLDFAASVETELIAIKRCTRPVGTTIRIPVSEHVASELLKDDKGFWETDVWDWYVLTNPSLKRFALGHEKEQRHTITAVNDDFPGWRRIDPEDYTGVFWKYGDGPEFVCNGMNVVGADLPLHKTWWLGSPNVIVNDPNGKLPLNLERSKLTTDNLPFVAVLGEDITRYLCAFALTELPTSLDSVASAFASFGKSKFGHLCGDLSSSDEWFFTSTGIGLRHPWIVRQTPCKAVVLIRFPSLPSDAITFQDSLREDTAYALVHHENTLGRLDWWLRKVTEIAVARESSPIILNANLVSQISRKGTRILMTKFAKERYEAGNIPRTIWRNVEVEWEQNGWVMATIGNVVGAQFPFQDFANQCPPPDRCSSIVEAVLDTTTQLPEPPLLVEHWMKILGQPLIPIDLVARKAQFATAYQTLAPYIEAVAEEYHPKKK